MFREFLRAVEELAVKIQDGSEREEYDTNPVAEGEETIGVVTDPWVRALFLTHKRRIDALLSKRTAEMSDDEVEKLNYDCEVLNGFVWGVLHSAFNIFDGTIGFRAGWTVVKMVERRPRGIMVEMVDLGNLLGALSRAGDPPLCDNPDCPACNARRMAAMAGGKVAQA